jgi:hypothetical protein
VVSPLSRGGVVKVQVMNSPPFQVKDCVKVSEYTGVKVEPETVPRRTVYFLVGSAFWLSVT